MFAKRTEDVEPFLAMEVMERGMAMSRAGTSIVQLGVGEPDFDAPPPAVEAAIDSLRSGQTHYTDSRGIFPLREAIAIFNRKQPAGLITLPLSISDRALNPDE